MKNFKIRKLPIFILLITNLVLIISFNNCSQKSLSGSFDSSSNSEITDTSTASNSSQPTFALVLSNQEYSSLTSSSILSDDTTPNFRLKNYQVNDSVTIFNSQTCESGKDILTLKTTLESPMDVSIPFPLTDGSYYFSVQFVSSSNAYKTSCVALKIPYIINTKPPTLTSISPTSLNSLTGGTITLTGTNFVDNMIINVGSSKCLKPKLINESQMTCVAPPFFPSTQYVLVSKAQDASKSAAEIVYVNPTAPIGPICTNGNITTSVVDEINNKLYFGGSFSLIGTCSGSGLIIDSKSERPIQSIIEYPKVAGTILTSISDGAGGFYIGGSFKSVGGMPHSNIAHIYSDGSIDPKFISKFELNDSVNALALDSQKNILYAGGNFTAVTPQLKTGGAQVDVTTGTLLLNQPKINGIVYTSVSDNNGGVYVGGSFTDVNGIPISNLAHILSNGQLDTNFNPNPNDAVRSLLMLNSVLFVGGSFTSISGEARNYIASINTANSNSLTAFNPAPNGIVLSMASVDSSSSTLFIGGNFSTMNNNSISKNYLAEINASSGNVTSFEANVNSPVKSIAIANSQIYIAGSFTTVGGSARNRVAAVSLTGTLNTNFVADINGTVESVSVGNSNVYIGGQFTLVNSVARNFLAALNSASGSLITEFNPNPNNSVYSVFVYGSNLYVGGSFTVISSTIKSYLAALNANTGAILNFESNLNGAPMTITKTGQNLYVGGQINGLGGEPRGRVLALETTTGNLLSFNPRANSSVSSLALSESILYLGGSFTMLGNQVRNYAGAIDLNTNQVNAHFDPNANSNVNSILVYGSNVYIGGSFTTLNNGQAKARLAAYQKSSANSTYSLLSSFNPNPNSVVLAMAISENKLYVGGSFTSISGLGKTYLAALDPATGDASSFSPSINDTVRTIAVSSDTIFIGGNFTIVGGQTRNYLAAIDLVNSSVKSLNPSFNGAVTTLTLSNAQLFVGGGFNSIDTVSRSNLASIDTSTKNATAFNPNPNSNVKTMALYGSTLYIGGSFTQILSQSRTYLASIDLTQPNNPQLTTFNPSPSSTIISLVNSGPKLYIAGNFTSIAGQGRNYFAEMDISSAANVNLTSLNLNPNSTVNTIALQNSILYLGGAFQSISGTSRSNLAAFDLTSGVLVSNFNPNITNSSNNSAVNSISISGGVVYVGGTFTKVNNQDRSYFAAINASNGSLMTLNPKPNNDVRIMLVSGSNLFFGGNFTYVGGEPRNKLASIDLSTGNLQAFDPMANLVNINSSNVFNLNIYNSNLMITGSFQFADDKVRNNLVGVDPTTGEIKF